MACLQKMMIPTNSMSPALSRGDLINVNMMFDVRTTPERWDIIIFTAPEMEGLGKKLGTVKVDSFGKRGKSGVGKLEATEASLKSIINSAAKAYEKNKVVVRPHVFYIKRVIALPGEVIQFKNSQILLNGERLELPSSLRETYAKLGTTTKSAFGAEEYKIPKDAVFVMSDNHKQAIDSRHIGAIPLDFVIGKVESKE